jgi:hypothetical protein
MGQNLGLNTEFNGLDIHLPRILGFPTVLSFCHTQIDPRHGGFLG